MLINDLEMEFHMNFKKIVGRTFVVCLLTITLSACSFSKIVNIVKDVITVVRIASKWFPPAADLANFDASVAIDNYSLQNMSFATNTAQVTITISDEITGALLGEQTYTVNIINGQQAVFANPAAVTSWVRSFATYQNGQGFVEVNVASDIVANPPPPGTTGTVSSTFTYAGTPLASSSGSYTSPTKSTCEARCYEK